MALAERMATTLCETATYEPGRKNARASVSRMSSSELLRFGLSAKFRLSLEPTADDPEPTELSTQLNEARLEWNRRHPDLPLRDSF
jgi:hypothetical protein